MASPERDTAESTNRATLGRARRWLYRLIALLLAPILAVLLLEGGLRVAGYGDADDMFVRAPDGNSVVTRSRYGSRFFPPALLRAPLPHSFAAKKPADTYRIFILGGSAAKGVPEPAFSFARMLDVMLEETFPDRDFKVINTALTAINSHVVLPIAEECAEYEPDLFIVYMGNNEVVGPYGPGTVFDAFTASRGAIRAGIWLRGTRTGQLIGAIAGLFGGDQDELRVWKGMELFLNNQISADDPRLESVYAHLHDNLADIITTGRDAGAEVVVCTVASNLKDNPPFASVQAGEEFVGALDEAGKAWLSGDFERVVSKATAALVLNDAHAGAHQRLGQGALALGNINAAREHFIRSRELDALRFRADNGVNDAIRAAAQENGATLVDIVERAAEASPNGIPGDNLFWEHVHLNFEGNYLVASALFDEVLNAIPQASGEVGNALYERPTREAVAARLAYTPWSDFKMAASIAALMARPPFTNQLDHEQRLSGRQFKLTDLRAALTPDGFVEIDATFQAAIENRPDDPLLRAQYATFLSEVGEREESITHWRRLVDQWPDRFDWRTSLARTLVDVGRIEDAVREFERVTELTPLVADAHANLGAAYMKALRFSDAATALDRALDLNPSHAAAHAQLADIAFRARDERGGIEHLKQAVENDPSLVPAVQQLSWILATHADASVRDPEEAVRIIEALPGGARQSDARLLDSLAAAKAHLGEFDKAIDLCRTAEQLLTQQGNPDAARAIAARRAMYERGETFVMQ